MRAEPPLLSVEELCIELWTGQCVAPVVSAASVCLEAGDQFVVVGESGCGKTLLAGAVCGLLPKGAARIAAGRLLWRGDDLAGAPEDRWQQVRGRDIAFVMQRAAASLDPVWRVGDQLVEAMQAAGVRSGDLRQRAREWLERVGLDAARATTAWPHELSGGMAQRVAIALALCTEPALVVADEPTSALDAPTGAAIVDLLAAVTRERHAALWLVTHDLAIARRLPGATLAVMYAGAFVERGPLPAVFETPRHPYTRALRGASLLGLGAAATPGASGRRAFGALPGRVPAPGHWPDGCRFSPRCPRADARCRAELPPWTQDGAHGVACFHPLDTEPAPSEDAT